MPVHYDKGLKFWKVSLLILSRLLFVLYQLAWYNLAFLHSSIETVTTVSLESNVFPYSAFCVAMKRSGRVNELISSGARLCALSFRIGTIILKKIGRKKGNRDNLPQLSASSLLYKAGTEIALCWSSVDY